MRCRVAITSEKIKEKVDEAHQECWKLICNKINDLGIKEDNRASWIYVQRVCNVLWLKANPHAEYILNKTMKDEV